jgi:uncharacterized protein (TIGR02391 family)
MLPPVDLFEAAARLAFRFTDANSADSDSPHPFDLREIHPAIAAQARSLFDDGHYPQATFEAMKFLEHEVRRHSNLSESGQKLMMRAFIGNPPAIALTPNSTQSELDEQEGYKFLFAGAVSAIRNPRGHEVALRDSLQECLDHLAFVSMLLRRLASSGYM